MLLIRIYRMLTDHFKNFFLYYLILTLALVSGIVIGPLLIKIFNLESKIRILRLANPYFSLALTSSYLENSVLRASIVQQIYLVLVICLMGFLNVGFYILPLVLLAKGITLGFTVGFLVSNMGLKGLVLSIGGIYPQNLFILAGLIGLGAVVMSTKEVVRKPLSRVFINYHKGRSNDAIVLGILYTIILLIGAILEGILSPRILGLSLDYFIKL